MVLQLEQWVPIKILVGAPQDDTAGRDSGSVYVFDINTTATGITQNLILAINNPFEVPRSGFGKSVDAAGDLILASAPDHLVNRVSGAGAVYVFDGRLRGNISDALVVLDNQNPTRNDNYGRSVSVLGDKFVIGIPNDDTAGSNTGASFNAQPTITLPTVSSPPTNVTSSTISESSILVRWSPPTDDGGYPISGYDIYQRTTSDSGSPFNVISTVDSLQTSIVDSGLNSNTSYSYQISASNLLGSGNASTITSTSTFYIPNNAPILEDIIDVTIYEDNIVSFDVIAMDSDTTDILTFSLSSNPSFVMLTDHGNQTATIEISPSIGNTGTYTSTVHVSDGQISNSNSFTVTVLELNSAPTVSNITASNVQEDQTIPITLSGNDAQNDSLTFEIVSGPTHGTLGPTQKTTNSSATVLFTPDSNYNGIDSFRYTANDGALDSSVATVSITINPVNDPPVSRVDFYNMSEDATMTLSILDNDSDVDGIDTLLVHTVNTTSTAGTVTNNGGTVTFTPSVNFNGDTTFSYVSSDGNVGGLSASTTVRVTVHPINDPPVAVDDDGNNNQRRYPNNHICS